MGSLVSVRVQDARPFPVVVEEVTWKEVRCMTCCVLSLEQLEC